jgi:hypothetical protein
VRDLYEVNKDVYQLLRYGMKVSEGHGSQQGNGVT